MNTLSPGLANLLDIIRTLPARHRIHGRAARNGGWLPVEVSSNYSGRGLNALTSKGLIEWSEHGFRATIN